METRFKNSRCRVDRAEDHSHAFYSQWKALLDKDPLTAIGSYDQESGWFVARVNPSVHAIERIRGNTLSLELGEMAYQLRSALDGLIWEAITIVSGAEPSRDADGVNRLEFPILNGKNRNFKNCAFHDFPFPHQLGQWLESIQPDSAEKPIGDPYRGLKTTLEDIHDLARHDRHRRLRVVAAAPTMVDFHLSSDDPTSQIANYEIVDSCDLLSGKYEFIRFKVDTATGRIPNHVRLHTNISFEIFAEHVEPYNGEDMGVQLQRFIQAVDMVIEKFEELVP